MHAVFSQVYSDQREDPKYLLPERKTEFYYDSADPNDPRISKLQRCTAVTSVTGLLNEVDEAIEYVKAHSKVEIDYSQEDGEIVKQTIDDTNVAPKRRSNKPTVTVAEEENASKRSFDSIMPPEHVLHPSKTQRTASTEETSASNDAPKVARTFGDMTPQIMQAHKTSAYFTDKNGNETKVMDREYTSHSRNEHDTTH